MFLFENPVAAGVGSLLGLVVMVRVDFRRSAPYDGTVSALQGGRVPFCLMVECMKWFVV